MPNPTLLKGIKPLKAWKALSPTERAANLQKFLEGSKVVSSEGKPLVMYHGTPGNTSIDVFDLEKANKNDPDVPVVGFHFSSKKESAERAGRYPWGRPNAEHVTVESVYLSIKNPAKRADVFKVSREIGSTEPSKITKALIERGYDGVVMRSVPEITDEMRTKLAAGEEIELSKTKYLKREDGEVSLYDDKVGGFVTSYKNIDDFLSSEEYHYVAFDPKQIKSATGNSGTFDPTDPRITAGVAGATAAGVAAQQDNKKAASQPPRIFRFKPSKSRSQASSQPAS